MKEQIEKQAVNEITELLWHFPKTLHLNCYADCYEVAKLLHKESYRKQIKGEWKAYPDEHEICATEFVCSHCKESFCTNEMTDWEFLEMMKYCPNCGAKMKGGES